MNNLNKTLCKVIGILLLFILFNNGTKALNVDLNYPSYTSSCEEADKRVDYYIPNGENTISIDYPRDNISGINDLLLISNAETSINLWNNTDGTLNCGEFSRASKVVPPQDGYYIAAIADDECYINKTVRENTNLPAAQLVYNIAFKREEGFLEGTGNYYYYNSGSTVQHFIPDQTKRNWGDVEYHGNECYNIYTHYCGDGVEDYGYEQCDDGPNGSSTCTSTCESITPPPSDGTDVCGDGIIDQPNDAGVIETCDDGNTFNGDGCSSTCQMEASISVDKVDINSNDRDLVVGANVLNPTEDTPGYDTQTIMSGSLAVFGITIRNDGIEDLEDITISDAMGPNCGISDILGNSVIVDLDALPATFLSPVWSGFGDHTDNIFQVGEILNYECTSDLTAPTYTNTISVEATSTTNSIDVSDSDVSDVIVLPFDPNDPGNTPVTFINKVDANTNDLDNTQGDDTQTISAGSGAVFSITVTNTGSEAVTNLVITDDFAPQCNRTTEEIATLIANQAGNNNNMLDPTRSFTYVCSDDVVPNGYTNIINVTGSGVTSGTSVLSSDTSIVLIDGEVISACTNLSVSPSSSTSSFTSNYTCTSNDPSATYRVELTDPSGGVTNTTSQTGNFSINSNGEYIARCFVNGETTAVPVCTQTLSISDGGGGGGSSTVCRSGTFTSTTATCIGSAAANYMRFSCQNGTSVTKSGNDVTFTLADCNDESDTDGPVTAMNWSSAKCYALVQQSGTALSRATCEYNPGGGGGGGGGGSYCGDGSVQRPNNAGFLEECDSNEGCSSDCKLSRTTFPTAANILISGNNNHYMIGNTMNLYQAHGISKPTITNISTNVNADYYIDELCVHKLSGNSLTGEVQCSPVGMLYPDIDDEFNPGSNEVTFNGDITFVGNTAGMTDTQEVNTVQYTIRHDNGDGNGVELYDWAYFAKDFDVTVLKPTITTTGGGTSFVNNNNISDLSDSGLSDNSNTVGASLGNNISSYSKSNIDETIAEAEGENLNNNISDNIIEDTDAAGWIQYNGMDNVYYYNGSTTIDQSFVGTTGESKTYIVKGNLTINENITYSNNIAFIVKGGNLIIGDSVTEIKGTYIVLPDTNGNGGNIRGVNVTLNQLLVRGSLYGDTTDLLSKRTYIKNNSNGQIDVGTIVSFGSSIFRKPAPLTTTFLDQYLEATKVAQ
ncbi:hypothetical protein N8455_00310 [Candidatus Gracilibacteria bacterium]|nr:hypothetical protein [Candidatus Gracilibacteria bacterium]